jgi:hypothetical protein
MKIICTKCGLVHTSRTTDHLTDRLCCYDTVRLVSFEIEEKLKAEYAKLYPLPCDCGSMITNKEPEKLCCRFTMVYHTNGLMDKVGYEVERDNHREAKGKGITPVFKKHVSIKDMDTINRMVRGERVKMERSREREYVIRLDCAKVVFTKNVWAKGFYAFLYIDGWDDRGLWCMTMKEHAQQIGRKLACMFTHEG